MAIENCKEIILEAPPTSEKYKRLVMKLVQLRYALQEMKDGIIEIEPEQRVILGHKFQKTHLDRSHYYCDKCCRAIWAVVQTCYVCVDCSLRCHSKCLNLLMRHCAKERIKENPNFILDICPEQGLAAQKYRCAECRCAIIPGKSAFQPRRCDYNGLYYCQLCHWNSEAVIPARVIHNWDFKPRKVSQSSYQLLQMLSSKPILNVEELNPFLFNFVHELSTTKNSREDIMKMKQYFMVCHKASEERLLLELQDRQHFVENTHMYSLQDLIDLNSGKLTEYLQAIHAKFYNHISVLCESCKGKGFICELCNADEVLFVFSSRVSTCPDCGSVYHWDCYNQRTQKCPYCIRKREKAQSMS